MIMQLAKLDAMTVRAQVAEADVMRLKPNLPVYFTTLGAGERRWQGTIRQILPSPEVVNNVVLYNVLVDVDNRDRQLMSGMSTQMFFVLSRASQVPLLPIAALGPRLPEADNEKGRAYRVKQLVGDNVQDKTVHIGALNRRFAQVLDGVEVGAKLQPLLKVEDKNSGKKKDRGYPTAGVPRL
jgi:macrolide-specific efflux system membrane fusion protein